MANTIPSIQPGALAPKETHRQVITELDKLDRFLTENKELATNAIDKLPVSREQKTALKVYMGGELNVHEGKSTLKITGQQIKQVLKSKEGSKEFTKEEKNLLGAQAAVCEMVGEIEELIAKGRTSYKDAFNRKRVDGYIRATLTLADKGVMDKDIALENLERLERFKDKLPDINAAITKNNDRIQKLKSAVTNPTRQLFFKKASAAGQDFRHTTPTEKSKELIQNPALAQQNVTAQAA